MPAPKPPLPPSFEGQLYGEPFVKVGTRHRPQAAARERPLTGHQLNMAWHGMAKPILAYQER
jgi:hypothetical protein